MISKFFFRILFFMRLLALVVGVLASLPAGASPYDDLVSSAREHLEAARFKEGLESANKAVLVNPNDYKGHYYVAMANMSLDLFDEADAAASRSLNSAPVSAKAGVEKLSNAIKDRRAIVKPNQSFIFLACSGSEKTDAGPVSFTMEFNRIYRINVTEQKIDSWNNGWSAFRCDDPKRPASGYTEWNQWTKCSVEPENFFATSSDTRVDDKGVRFSNYFDFRVSRVTGALKIGSLSTIEQIDGEKTSDILRTAGSCAPTTEPVSKAAAVRF